jgi:hypothetical protein
MIATGLAAMDLQAQVNVSNWVVKADDHAP